VTEQATAIAGWLPSLSRADWEKPTPLPDWSVSHLVLHLAQTLRTVTSTLREPTGAAPITVADYLAALPGAATEIRDRELAATDTAEGIVATYSEQLQLATAALRQQPGPAVVPAPRGPMRLADFLATRALELTVHADDLGRALPDRPPPMQRPATGVAVRLLADALATAAPGRSVEVRIPPYAAVQCVPGPRHTRGTPPTVIETDPVTWLRLATGRLHWRQALDSGRVSASGERSDLSVYLPVLR
jgi:uncharacterized protein (TIGR03083 family)